MHPFIHIGPFNLPAYGLCMATGVVVNAATAIDGRTDAFGKIDYVAR